MMMFFFFFFSNIFFFLPGPQVRTNLCAFHTPLFDSFFYITRTKTEETMLVGVLRRVKRNSNVSVFLTTAP